jgi:DNA (cytosine-5)-methyltransferase 1
LGLEQAGFEHVCLVELDSFACDTLRYNRPNWNVVEGDLRAFQGRRYRGIDLLAGGVPCPPFSIAGKKLGNSDERDLFPEAIRLVDECRPQAVMLENVRGLLDSCFDNYRSTLIKDFKKLGYEAEWRLLNASDFGVPQLRPRVVFVALKREVMGHFSWPDPIHEKPPPVGKILYDLMAARGWRGVDRWREMACDIAPTLVGGSKKHGGPDLGPTRARRAWASLGVDGLGIANEAPDSDFAGMPRLTLQMVARLQGFPDDWIFCGRKTNVYRQIGNAFPPPVAKAVGFQIAKALQTAEMYTAKRA